MARNADAEAGAAVDGDLEAGPGIRFDQRRRLQAEGLLRHADGTRGRPVSQNLRRELMLALFCYDEFLELFCIFAKINKFYHEIFLIYP